MDELRDAELTGFVLMFTVQLVRKSSVLAHDTIILLSQYLDLRRKGKTHQSYVKS